MALLELYGHMPRFAGAQLTLTGALVLITLSTNLRYSSVICLVGNTIILKYSPRTSSQWALVQLKDVILLLV